LDPVSDPYIHVSNHVVPVDAGGRESKAVNRGDRARNKEAIGGIHHADGTPISKTS
jgi:hypothetical protein